MSTEQDVLIAKFCGWTWDDTSATAPNGITITQHSQAVDKYWWCPPYSKNMYAMSKAEERIAEMGLVEDYCRTLAKDLGVFHRSALHWTVVWEYATATPQQRAAALFSVLKRLEEGKDE